MQTVHNFDIREKLKYEVLYLQYHKSKQSFRNYQVLLNLRDLNFTSGLGEIWLLKGAIQILDTVLLVFLPTKTLSSILIRELQLRSNKLRLVKCPNVPSFNRDKLLDAKLTSDNFGEVSNKWTPMKGKAFRDISATKKIC